MTGYAVSFLLQSFEPQCHHLLDILYAEILRLHQLIGIRDPDDVATVITFF
jgi:hypothetical protein